MEVRGLMEGCCSCFLLLATTGRGGEYFKVVSDEKEGESSVKGREEQKGKRRGELGMKL